MADKSTLNKLYFEILLSKNKLPLLQTYYSNIKNEILTDLTNLHNLVMSAQSWVNAQINYLNTTRTTQATNVNNFVASSSDSLIVSHVKYIEMMERYKEYVSNFYTRIHSLENTGVSNSYTVNNFIANEIGQLSSYWKFHYTDNYGNALPIEHKFCALNITSESEIIEISNSRYLYFTNESVVCDVDYITKDVYIYYLDHKTLKEVSDGATFHVLLSVSDKSKIFAYVIDHKISNDDIDSIDSASIFGDKNNSFGVYSVRCLEYNINTHKFNVPSGYTSELYIAGNLLRDYKLQLVSDEAINDYYYVYIANYISRVKIDGAIEGYTAALPQKNANIIRNAVKFGNYFILPQVNDSQNNTRLVACKLSSNGSIDLFNPSAYVVLNAFAENDERFNNDNQIVKLFKATNIGGYGKEGIYVVTNTNIWFFDTVEDNTVIDVKIDLRKRSIGIIDYSFVDNDGLYTIDEFGYLYILKDNTYLYCAKTDESAVELFGNVVQAPTRYADKLINLQNVVSVNRAGYAFNKSDNITKAQLGDVGNEEFIYSFVMKDSESDPGILVGITKTGKAAYCLISTGEWNYQTNDKYCAASFTGDREITAICQGENDNTFYVALSNYNILKVTRREMYSGINLTSTNLVVNTLIGSRIKAMVYIDAYKVLYIATASGSVSAYDFNNDTYHTADVTSDSYVESDKSRYAITRGDDAIGNVSINCITTDGNSLIVMGALGRVASCSLSDFMWTPYKTSDDNISNYSSNIFYDGIYEKENGNIANCRDIVSFINYNNTKLIVFTTIGEIFSCNLTTGVWSDVMGKIVLHGGSGFGPGVFDTGDILGGKSPLAVIRTGSVIYVSGESARLGSISITDGAITEYRGTSEGANVGPGYSYTGEDVAETININSIVTDNRGKLFMLGTANTVLTYSIESNEVIVPSNNKLYYIARRQSKYDFMSSLLVRVSKGELNEKTPLYPPNEEDDAFTSYIQSANYVFKNGKYVWKINTALDILYFSEDGGVSYITVSNIEGRDVLPITEGAVEYVSCIPNGYVTKEGKLVAIINIGTSANTYVLKGNSVEDVKWIKLNDKLTQKQIDNIAPLESVDNLYVKNTNLDHYIRYKLSENNVAAETLTDTTEIYNDFRIQNNNLYNEDNILITDIYDKLCEYVEKVICDKSEDVKISKFYVSNTNDLNFVIVCGRSRIYVVTIHFIDISLGDIENNWIVSFKKIDFDLILRKYNTSTVSISDIDIKVNHDKTNAIALINYEVNNNVFLKTKGRSVLVSLLSDIYGEYTIPNYRIINEFDSNAKIVSYDPSLGKVYIALYNTVDGTGVIIHTNSVHSYRAVDSVVNTPIRALTNAWKTCQVRLGNGSDKSIPNALALRLKFNCNNDPDQDVVSTQFTLRYKVLISDITNGKFILFETEKSVGMSKADDDTRSIDPFFRVIAIDGFEDEIFDLYTSKLDRYHKVTSTNDLSEIIVSGYSYDFMTFIQRFTGDEDAIYQIKICCENTLPSNIDANFYVEPYYQDNTVKASYINNIKTSEYKAGISASEANSVFGGNITGFIVATTNDKVGNIKTPVSVNNEYVPQFEDNVDKVGISADTYMCIVRGDGTGLYDKISCVIIANDGKYSIVPLGRNKKELKYIFDEDGSSAINSKTSGKIDTLRNGRSVHKMHNRSVFSKNVVNNPDYYIDYEGKGRIVSVEGTLTNRYGLFEGISTIDGNQKRIKQISETRDGTKWSNANSAFDVIKKRNFGYGYDIIDRYSVFEEPYNMVKAWWIPAKSLLANGNERLHNFTFNEGKRSDVGLKYSPFDNIDNPTTINTKHYTGGSNPINNGICATMNGATVASPESVEAYTELIDEKFPLENWKGWEWAKMCFIRKWRKVFTDKHIEYKYEVEAPSRVTVSANGTVVLAGSPIYVFDSIPYTTADFNATSVQEFIASITPSIDRQLYWYSDKSDEGLENDELRSRNEFEGISVETWRRATAYYYTSHNWSCILDEVLSLDHPNFFDGEDEDLNNLRECHNYAQISNEEFDAFMANTPNVSRSWYVTSSTDSVNTDNVELRHYDERYTLDTNQSAPHQLDNIEDESSVSFKTYPFPIASLDDGNIVGERVVNITFNTPEEVVKSEISEESIDWTTGNVMPKSHYIKKWVRGINAPIIKSGDNELVGYVPVNGYLDENKSQIDVELMYKFASDLASIDDENDRSNINRKLIQEYITAKSAKMTYESYTTVSGEAKEDVTTIGVPAAVKISSTDNTNGFNYGVGKISYAIGSVYDEPNNSISVTIREYHSISKADLEQHPELEGKFVAYYDTTYTVNLTTNPVTKTVEISRIPANETRVTVTAGVLPTLDSYCGKSSLSYLYKNPHIIHINNLIKNNGYTSVSKNIVAWNVKDTVLSSEVENEIISHYEPSDFDNTYTFKPVTLTNEDVNNPVTYESLINVWLAEHDDFMNNGFTNWVKTQNETDVCNLTDTVAAGNSITIYGAFRNASFNINKYKRTAYPEDYIFLTQDKNQSYSGNETDAVDRVFVKQYFTKEHVSDPNISWRDYALIYNRTIANYPVRTNNVYPQTYVWLDLFDKNISASVNSEIVNSAHCWVHLNTGTLDNNNLKIVSDSTDGLDSYVAGEFCYMWYDGTIKKIKFTIDDQITIQDLINKGFISTYGVKTEVVQRRENSDLFDKITTIVVSGYSIKHDSTYVDVIESDVTLLSTETVEYAEDIDTVGDNASISNVANWNIGTTGSGDENGTGFEEPYDGTGVETNETYPVNYNLTDMKVKLNTSNELVSIGSDTAYRYTAYSTIIKANDGYKLPTSISVRIGDSTGVVGAESYSYDRIYTVPNSYTKGTDTALGNILDELEIPQDDDTYEFMYFSLDGEHAISESDRELIVDANKPITIYSVFCNKKEARFTVFGEKITGIIEVTGNAEYIV